MAALSYHLLWQNLPEAVIISPNYNNVIFGINGGNKGGLAAISGDIFLPSVAWRISSEPFIADID